MCPDWRDFVLNFAVCSADFYLPKRIHDLVSVPRIAFKDYLMDFFSKNFQESFLCLMCSVCSFIKLAQNTIVRYSIQFDFYHITQITFA